VEISFVFVFVGRILLFDPRSTLVVFCRSLFFNLDSFILCRPLFVDLGSFLIFLRR